MINIPNRKTHWQKATLTFYPLQNDFPGSNSPFCLAGFLFVLPWTSRMSFISHSRGKKRKEKKKKPPKHLSNIASKIQQEISDNSWSRKENKALFTERISESGCPSQDYCFINLPPMFLDSLLCRQDVYLFKLFLCIHICTFNTHSHACTPTIHM